jgi:hypothetical protein
MGLKRWVLGHIRLRVVMLTRLCFTQRLRSVLLCSSGIFDAECGGTDHGSVMATLYRHMDEEFEKLESCLYWPGMNVQVKNTSWTSEYFERSVGLILLMKCYQSSQGSKDCVFTSCKYSKISRA